MKKFSLYLFAATVLWSHHTFGMEEKNISVEKEENNELEVIRPYKYIPIEEQKNTCMSFDETDKTTTTHHHDYLALKKYDEDGKLIKEYQNKKYLPVGQPTTPQELHVFFEGTAQEYEDEKLKNLNNCEIYGINKDLLPRIFLSEQKKPFGTYNMTTDEIAQLDYEQETGDLFGFLTLGSTNRESSEWKVISFRNTKDGTIKTKIILFDKNNKIMSTISQKDLVFVLELSPSGNSLIYSCYSDKYDKKNPVTDYKIYDISDKKDPKLIRSFNRYRCWYHPTKNIFCDQKRLYNEQGDLLHTITNNKWDDVIGFSYEHYIVRNSEHEITTVGKIDGSEKPRQLYHDWKARVYGANIIDGKEIALYDFNRLAFQKIALYTLSKDKEPETGYFSKCILN